MGRRRQRRRHHGGGGGCELCGAPAAVHCEADAAFLCAACDATVHGANSLASRHHRTRLVVLAPAPDEDGCESAASSRMSSTDSAASAAPPAGSGSGSGGGGTGARRRRRRAATDAVEGWDECAWAGPKSSPPRS